MKQMYRWVIVLFALAGMLAVPSVFAQGPTGASPFDPLIASSEQRVIGANSTLWFSFEYPGDKSKVQVGLEANGAMNLRLAIYTPQQVNAWFQDPGVAPIGVGTKSGEGTAPAGYDLFWSGSFNLPGRYFIVLTNYNPTLVYFRLRVTGESITLFPTPTPTLGLASPLATPIPIGTIQGKLVFQQSSGGAIYTVNGDGTNLRRITAGMDPSWSPDGTKIAFTRWEDKPGVYIANADGSNEVSLMGINQALSPQWCPNGRALVFTRPAGGTPESQFCFRGSCFTQLADPRWKLGVIEIGKVIDDNTTINALTEPPCTNHCFSPTWSNDGRYIAYADAGFGIMRTDTMSNTLWIMYNQNPKVQSVAWSPDGTKIAFQINQHDHWEILVMNSNATNVTPVTRPDLLSFRPANNVAPTWSPDSQQILFLSDRNSKWEFFVANVDGANIRQVLKNVSDTVGVGYNFSNERVISWMK